MDIWNRIEGSLEISDHWTKKEFWYGFLTGLVDFDVISHKHYVWLRNNVSAYKNERS